MVFVGKPGDFAFEDEGRVGFVDVEVWREAAAGGMGGWVGERLVKELEDVGREEGVAGKERHFWLLLLKK